MHRCVNYTGTVCRDVIGSGPVLADTATEAGFEAYKKNYTALGVNVDAKCEAFLRAQYCGLSLVTCSGEVRCGPYSENEIGQCGVNSCPCPGSGFIQQACNAGLKFGFSVIGGGLSYYKTGEQPGNMNCTTINIREYQKDWPLVGIIIRVEFIWASVMHIHLRIMCLSLSLHQFCYLAYTVKWEEVTTSYQQDFIPVYRLYSCDVKL